jgi:hypothetical protein
VESTKLEKRIEAAREEIATRQNLQMRLQSIFLGLSRSFPEPVLYSKSFPDEKGLSLVAIFDQGIDPDPVFSGSVLGRIYLDEDNNLNLAIWPLGSAESASWRKEILFTNVSDFEFEFLSLKTKKEGKEKSRPINESLEWILSWSKSRSDTPSIIRLSIWKNESRVSTDPLRFAFILPSAEPIVTYNEGGGFKI